MAKKEGGDDPRASSCTRIYSGDDSNWCAIGQVEQLCNFGSFWRGGGQRAQAQEEKRLRPSHPQFG